jgi:MATE family multidrug resistance protein
MPKKIRSELRILSNLAWPVVIGMLGGQLMNIVDMVMVGRLGEKAIATISMGFLWSIPMVMFLIGCIRGMDPIVTQAHGAGETHKTGLALARALLIGAFCILPAIIWHLSAAWGLELLRQPEKLIEPAAEYAKALLCGVPGMLIYQALRGYLQGVGIMRPAAMVMLGANFINIPLNWLLIYGTTNFEGLGAIGCGWSTAICQNILPLWLWLKCRQEFSMVWPGRKGVINLEAIRQQCALGIPIAFQICLEMWAFNAAGFIVGSLGSQAIAAHTITLNVATTAWMLPMGISGAATTRVGNLLGAAKSWHLSAWLSIGMASVCMCTSLIVFIVFPAHLARLYTDDPAVVSLATKLLPIAGAFQIVDGIQAVAGGILRGLADVRIPAVALIVAHWLIGLPLGSFWAIHKNLGPQGIWWGLVVALTLTAFFFSMRILHLQRRGVERI